ncbi:hypothetical protein JNJ66_02145 [Candidatus Saccharibacteria bacterium]|nr:hypothetical protein [Candidatus Saccharibacteria bacterium]
MRGLLKATLLFFLPGVVLGGAAVWWLKVQPLAADNNRLAAENRRLPEKQSSSQIVKNIETMNMNEMVDALQTAPDSDFERQYFLYAIQLNHQAAAINRISSERTKRDELKKFNETYGKFSTTASQALLKWQKDLGLSHH